jgi:mono/diheme cytochrome c family protein
MTNRASRFTLPALLLLPLIGSYGGWAAITVQDLPDYVVVGQPVTLTFTVRQHGVTKLSGLKARVEAQAGDLSTAAAATPGPEAGQYVAALALPRAGEWTITIHSGFGNSRVTLLPLRAIPAGSAAPAPLAEGERGRRLFVAKGCITCHVHGGVEGSGVVAVGPDLTARRLAPDYLRQFLANPAIAARSGPAQMPNLDLKPQEIAALTAFINAEGRATQ